MSRFHFFSTLTTAVKVALKRITSDITSTAIPLATNVLGTPVGSLDVVQRDVPATTNYDTLPLTNAVIGTSIATLRS